MKKFLRIALKVLVGLALSAYLVFAVRHCSERQRDDVLRKVEIAMADTLDLIDAGTVRGWLDEAGLAQEGTPLQKVDTRTVVDTILSRPFVKNALVYVQQSGTMYVEVAQRRPVARLTDGHGNDAYLTDDLHLVPTRPGAAQYVPVVTGEIPLENLQFLEELINFVESVVEGPVWKGRIVQLVVHAPSAEWGEPEIELIPRAGRFRVMLGDLGGASEKMEKLALFYRNVLPWEGWDTYAVLDIGNRDQIVCRK